MFKVVDCNLAASRYEKIEKVSQQAAYKMDDFQGCYTAKDKKGINSYKLNNLKGLALSGTFLFIFIYQRSSLSSA
jgi:hypothetical protein